MKIETKIIMKNREIEGYKVYIDGRKYPQPPVKIYKCSEDIAIMKALADDSEVLYNQHKSNKPNASAQLEEK